MTPVIIRFGVYIFRSVIWAVIWLFVMYVAQNIFGRLLTLYRTINFRAMLPNPLVLVKLKK